MLVDTHCHLDAAEFATDRAATYAAARAAGVGCIIVPAVSAANFAEVRAVARAFPACRPAYGIHPLYVDEASTDDLGVLREWLERERPLAVGEIGLDFYVDRGNSVRQTEFFVAQLELAREFDLPVLLHVRRAIDEVLKQLRRVRVRGGIAHAFNGSRQQAEMFIELGFKLGFGGAMTHAGSSRIRALAAELPAEALVLETDAPDIPPAWLQGGRNAPGELPRIADVLAALRGEAPESLLARCRANAEAVLGPLNCG